MTQVTLADVAAAAGVSTATVSYVLRAPERTDGTIRVSARTRETVHRVARELGYMPSAAGRGLALGTAERIAIMVPNLVQPYFARMAEALILALEERGLSTTLRLAHDAAAERDAVLGRTTQDVAGVIICPHSLSAELLAGAAPALPTVQVGGAPTPEIDAVVMAEQEGLLTATRHLLDRGRRRIAYVADPWLPSHEGPRYLGYFEAHTERGLEVDDALAIQGTDWDRHETDLEAMVGLLRSGAPFDAVTCINDAAAVGAMRAASLAGLRIPRDVAFIGFDNTEEAAFTTPPLTSVDPGVPEMAQRAVAMLIARLEGESGPARRESAPLELIVRASTGD